MYSISLEVYESFVYREPVWHFQRVIHCFIRHFFVFSMAGKTFIHYYVFHSAILVSSLLAATLAFALGFPSFWYFHFWLARGNSCGVAVGGILNILFYKRLQRVYFLFQSSVNCLF